MTSLGTFANPTVSVLDWRAGAGKEEIRYKFDSKIKFGCLGLVFKSMADTCFVCFDSTAAKLLA